MNVVNSKKSANNIPARESKGIAIISFAAKCPSKHARL